MLSLRTIRRAATAALATTLLTSSAALADFVQPDADAINGGPQTTIDLGAVGPGAVLHGSVTFELVCSGFRHADPGQTVLLNQGGSVVPEVGGSISATGSSIGPVPGTWANDTHGAASCPAPMRLAGNGASDVTIVAPSVPGNDYELTVMYQPSFDIPGVSDLSSVAPFIMVTYRVDVVDADTTPPTLVDMPTGLELMTSDPAGAVLDYTPPTATDDRDPAPVVSCTPAPGEVAPVGASEVTCTATDATGNSASASFPVVVHFATVSWEEPVGDGGVLTVRGQRSVPVKVQAFLDGVPVTTGTPQLVVVPCGSPQGDVERTESVEYSSDSGRWMGHLSTAGLSFGCHLVKLMAGDLSLGGFTLDLQAASAARSGASRPR